MLWITPQSPFNQTQHKTFNTNSMATSWVIRILLTYFLFRQPDRQLSTTNPMCAFQTTWLLLIGQIPFTNKPVPPSSFFSPLGISLLSMALFFSFFKKSKSVQSFCLFDPHYGGWLDSEQSLPGYVFPLAAIQSRAWMFCVIIWAPTAFSVPDKTKIETEGPIRISLCVDFMLELYFWLWLQSFLFYTSGGGSLVGGNVGMGKRRIYSVGV